MQGEPWPSHVQAGRGWPPGWALPSLWPDGGVGSLRLIWAQQEAPKPKPLRELHQPPIADLGGLGPHSPFQGATVP